MNQPAGSALSRYRAAAAWSLAVVLLCALAGLAFGRACAFTTAHRPAAVFSIVDERPAADPGALDSIAATVSRYTPAAPPHPRRPYIARAGRATRPPHARLLRISLPPPRLAAV